MTQTWRPNLLLVLSTQEQVDSAKEIVCKKFRRATAKCAQVDQKFVIGFNIEQSFNILFARNAIPEYEECYVNQGYFEHNTNKHVAELLEALSGD